MRTGTRTERKKRWSAKGHRPTCKIKIGYEFTYLYAALNPYTGKLIALILPYMTKNCFQEFMKEFCEETKKLYGDNKVLLILDGAGSHQPDTLPGDSVVTMEKLPPACPELNPAERFFEQLRTELSNLVFETIDQVEQHLINILQKYLNQSDTISSLTLFSYIRH